MHPYHHCMKSPYEETLADKVVAFVIGAFVGGFVALAVALDAEVFSPRHAFAIIVGSGLFAAVAWKHFWRFLQFIAEQLSAF
jgi:hypothetical protein